MEDIILRKAQDSDSEFAYYVKKLAFGDYVNQVWGWDEAEQQQLHQKRFVSQEYRVIQWSGIDVGILATVKDTDCLKLNQLFILPDYQHKGIGRACMMLVIDEAASSKSPVKLQVLKVNKKALTFFQKLGFKKTGESDTHILMERLS